MKKIILIMMICLLTILPGCSTDKQVETIMIHGDSAEFDYAGINEFAPVIVKARIIDEYTQEKANLIGDYTSLMGFYGERNIEILEYYKNDAGLEVEQLKIIEPAVLYENKLICMEGYVPLVKDNEYILYLSNETGSGDWSVIGFGNGNINIGNITENEKYFDVAVKTIAKYDSDLTEEEKEYILSADKITLKSIDEQGVVEINVTKSGQNNILSVVLKDENTNEADLFSFEGGALNE